MKVKVKILGLLKVGHGPQNGLKGCGLICKCRIRILGIPDPQKKKNVWYITSVRFSILEPKSKPNRIDRYLQEKTKENQFFLFLFDFQFFWYFSIWFGNGHPKGGDSSNVTFNCIYNFFLS